MIVIADASPLHYLILVQAVDVLPRLFQRVLIPDEVCSELRHIHALAEVQRWIAAPPLWLDVRSVAAAASAAIPDLDAGEEAAIRLAEQLSGSAFLLMDDVRGRAAAKRRRDPEHGNPRCPASRIQEWLSSAARGGAPAA